MNQQVIDQLTRARTALVLDQPFVGMLALRLKLVENNNIPTLAVDGKQIIYNADFVADLSPSLTKSAIGHLLGAAGAVESIISLIALEGQWLPASLNVREADPVCGFDLVRTPREAVVSRVLTNSFGFGGANATLVFGKEGLA